MHWENLMQIWPAIDIRGGKCVRLKQGDYARETVFDDDPVSVAERWIDQGGSCLHLVDLDGARDGRVINQQAIQAIVDRVNVPCELGGGIRDEQAIQRWIDVGIDRLVVGTRAIEDGNWFREMAQKYPGKLVLGIDARDGQVATDGWLKTSSVSAVEMARDFDAEPLAAIVYTDISTDGMLAGPNLAAMAEMKSAVSCPVVASGGVTSIEDVEHLAKAGLDGAIVGRALYEDRLSLPDSIAAAERHAKFSGPQPRYGPFRSRPRRNWDD